jgi:hypothetical protein
MFAYIYHENYILETFLAGRRRVDEAVFQFVFFDVLELPADEVFDVGAELISVSSDFPSKSRLGEQILSALRGMACPPTTPAKSPSQAQPTSRRESFLHTV